MPGDDLQPPFRVIVRGSAIGFRTARAAARYLAGRAGAHTVYVRGKRLTITGADAETIEATLEAVYATG